MFCSFEPSDAQWASSERHSALLRCLTEEKVAHLTSFSAAPPEVDRRPTTIPRAAHQHSKGNLFNTLSLLIFEPLLPPWQRRTNGWRRATNPARGAKRLRGETKDETPCGVRLWCTRDWRGIWPGSTPPVHEHTAFSSCWLQFTRKSATFVYGRNHKRSQSVTFCQGAIEVRRHPIDENRGNALIFTGVGSLFTAIAAVLLEYPTFATIFAFFGAFALAVALRDAREGR